MPMQHDVLVHVRWSEHCCLELQGTVYDSPLGHGLGFLRGWRSWPLCVYSGRPRHRPWTVKRTLNLLPFSFFSLFFLSSLFSLSSLSLFSLSPSSLSLFSLSLFSLFSLLFSLSLSLSLSLSSLSLLSLSPLSLLSLLSVIYFPYRVGQ